MSRPRSYAAALAATLLALSAAACGSIPETAPTQPEPPSQAS